jgi:Ca-activated chloride channel family protein
MNFAHPAVLLLLVIPVTLAFWEWTRPGQTLVLPFDYRSKRRGRFLQLLVLCANTLPAMLLTVAILFVARPITFAPPQTERKLTNIQIVLDTSGSMAAPYGPQPSEGRYSRFDAAMDAIDQFLKFRQGDAFGLTIFSKNYIHWVPLTQDTNAISNSRPFTKVFTLSPAQGRPAHLTPGAWGNGTFIANALNGATDLLKQRPTGDRMIILVTDGESGDIQRGRDREIIEKLQAERITVFGINLNNAEIEEGMIHIAHGTGGEVFTAVDNNALTQVFRQIDQMKRVQILQKEPQVIDLFRPFFIPAAIILLLQTIVLFGLRFNPW